MFGWEAVSQAKQLANQPRTHSSIQIGPGATLFLSFISLLSFLFFSFSFHVFCPFSFSCCAPLPLRVRQEFHVRPCSQARRFASYTFLQSLGMRWGTAREGPVLRFFFFLFSISFFHFSSFFPVIFLLFSRLLSLFLLMPRPSAPTSGWWSVVCRVLDTCRVLEVIIHLKQGIKKCDH